jgi:membrane-associated phospholipid phosphatase
MLVRLEKPMIQSTNMKNLTFLLLLCCTIHVSAQTSRQPSPLLFSNDSAGRIKKKNKWVKPVVAVGYAGLIHACYKYWDPEIREASQKNTAGVKTFIARGVSDLGLGKFQTISLVSTSVVALVSGNERLRKTVLVWGGSLLINTIVTDQMKKGFQRHRPSAGLNHKVFEGREGNEEHTSFPSAHTSNAFTTATVFATLYKDEKWVAPAAYGLATLVGLSRIHENAHWASDVLAGAAIGFLSAKAMNGLYNLASQKFLFLPQAGTKYAGLRIVYHF